MVTRASGLPLPQHRRLAEVRHGPVSLSDFAGSRADNWFACNRGILDPVELSEILGLPDGVEPLAYLCLGYVSDFLPQPELEIKGWRERLPLSDLVHQDRWGQPAAQEFTTENLTEAKHTYELKPCGEIILNLDHLQAGLGSNSCGPGPLPHYLIEPIERRFGVRLRPFTWNSGSPMSVWRQALEAV